SIERRQSSYDLLAVSQKEGILRHLRVLTIRTARCQRAGTISSRRTVDRFIRSPPPFPPLATARPTPAGDRLPCPLPQTRPNLVWTPAPDRSVWRWAGH